MRIELRMSGGFTGVGALWSTNLSEVDSKQGTKNNFNDLFQLVAKCRADGVFSKDFTAAGKGAIPDAQIFELTVDNESAKWSEPPPSGSATPPESLVELKTWLQENLPRKPLAP